MPFVQRTLWARRTVWDERAAGCGFAALLMLPLALLHARALADILICVIDGLFLLHIALTRDEAGLRSAFAVAAVAWYVWLVSAAALAGGAVMQALVVVRLPLCACALGFWLLADVQVPVPARDAWRQRVLWWVLVAGFVWVGVECWQQYLTGENFMGQARYGDGSLTGPFSKPRAGPAFILLFFPVIVPVALMGARWRRARLLGWAVGAGLACLAAVTMVLIGQRMPVLLMGLGMVVCALMLRPLRWVVLVMLAAACALVAALPRISPDTQEKLVRHFSAQMAHFGETSYGLIYNRAWHMALLHPWLGWGFDGFRRGCWQDVPGLKLVAPAGPVAPGVEVVSACNLHPHNYYVEALVNAGFPGALFFAVMAGVAVVRLGRAAVRTGDALMTGLFIGLLVALWPLASTSSFTSLPNGGWVFLLLGFGLARGQRSKTVLF